MDTDVLSTVGILAILVLSSAYFSATETAFSAVNRIRLKNMAAGGNKRAELALKLSNNYSTLLSTILVGNNIVNIAATSISTVLFVSLFGGTLGPTVSTIVMTVVVLIFGEISPKTLASESPESFAIFSAPALKICTVILRPLNFIFSYWKILLSKIFRFSKAPTITEEELMSMVDEAQQEGAIEQGDKELIRNVMEFGDSRVSDILTPRVDVVGIPTGASIQEATDIFLSSGYTRLPVYEGSVDNIIGIIHLRDFFEAAMKNINAIEERMTPVVFVTAYAKINDVLTTLQREKSHFAVVAGEHGGIRGVLTMEDILEELVGEIWDEHDEIVEEIYPIEENVWQISGSADIDRVFETLSLDGEAQSSTVNGWIMEQLHRIPSPGDTFEYKHMHITIDAVENNRIITCHFRSVS